jgi:hypothetical protein
MGNHQSSRTPTTTTTEATATTTIYVQNCQFGSPVGITEYELNELVPTYYNLQGQPVDKAYNTLLIEQYL